MDSMLTPREAAEVLQYKRKTIYTLILRSKLEAERLPGGLLISETTNHVFFAKRHKYLEARGLLKPQPQPAAK